MVGNRYRTRTALTGKLPPFLMISSKTPVLAPWSNREKSYSLRYLALFIWVSKKSVSDGRTMPANEKNYEIVTCLTQIIYKFSRSNLEGIKYNNVKAMHGALKLGSYVKLSKYLNIYTLV